MEKVGCVSHRMSNVFSHQCISALEKANGTLGKLRPKVLCIGAVKTHEQLKKKYILWRKEVCFVLCSL